ncbi:death domain-containing protein [Phthorimaea operculella]|nr:death domain-containing protein [Phthorimaea operculella]
MEPDVSTVSIKLFNKRLRQTNFNMEALKDFENADTISIDTLALEETLQEERAKEIAELKMLGKKVWYLHTSLLYYRNPATKTGKVCFQVWQTLVKKVGGSPNTWKELGHALGIAKTDLDYIGNTVKEDRADVILKIFLHNENATIDKIIEAFLKMERYDIIKEIEEPLLELSQCFDKDDSGYQSNSSKKIISYTKNLPNDLPAALSKKYVLHKKDPDPPSKQIKLPPKREEKVKSDEIILFLSYAEDGIETAYNIKYYVENWTDFPGVKVVTLNDRREEVFQNPEKFIRDYFEKAEFVVPILTAGYLQEIRSCNPTLPSTSDNLDCKYVNFIYNLIINQYIHASGCMNLKVRSVLPQNSVHVARDISLYPDLMPWTFENDFDEQFKAFLRSNNL